jgi:class 3 adenylate cyclase
MRCPKCGTDNSIGNKFCTECGAGLPPGCSQCGAVSAPAAKFCSECGAPLNAPVSPSVTARLPSPAPEVAGERRHLTILFCDLVGSVTLAARLDPEEWRATLASYQRAATEAITRFEGEVVRYVGDGIMAFFGYPAAHDNDAERAARAGLAILDAIALLNQQPVHAELAVRIGINSGHVVVGTGAGNGVDAFGDAPNIAARVQAAAEPGTVMISDATQRLVAGLFVVEDRGAQALKGIERPVCLYRVIRPSGMRGRFEVMAAAGGLTPFVGREDELRSLVSRWERVRDGEGQVALIIGEAGIGKSRLLQRFHEEIADTPHTWVEAGAGAFFQNTPFYPIGEMLRQFVTDAPDQDQIPALASRLTAAGLAPAESIPLLAPLLNLPLPPEYPPSPLSPEHQRRRLLATLVEWVLGSALTQPLVIATEDLHWADPSTLELIQLLVEQGATARLMLLYTARPEFRPPWPPRAHHTQVTLNRLSASNVRTLVGEVAARKALSEETIAAVVERTAGVPLFVEELTRAVLESGDAKLSGGAIPATLHDSLMARLDRLGSAKEVAQVGAVIGSDFSYELLRAVHPIAEVALQGALRSLTDAELLYVRGIAPEATYQFKHALIRDAAYDALLKSRRKELHLSVARAIDEKFPTLKETHPEVLARHWTAAGETELAIQYLRLAGERAVARGAMIEAERHFRCAIELLIDLPENIERDRQELGLLMDWRTALQAVKGYAHPETHRALARAQDLAERLGETHQITTLLNGLSASAFTLGQMGIAQELAERELRLAQLSGDRGLLCAAHRRLGENLLFSGEFIKAHKHLERASSYFDDTVAQRLTSLDAIVPSVIEALSCLQLGFADRSRQLISEALLGAKHRKNSFELVFVHMYACLCFSALRDPYALREHAEDLGRIANEVPFIRSHADYYAGRALLMCGEDTEGKARTRHGIALWQSTGFHLTRTWQLETEAAFCASEGRVEDALGLLAEVLGEKEEVLWRRAPALTLRADLLVRRGAGASEVEAGYREAIGCAVVQGSRLYELEATTQFARWLKSQGRMAEARTMLAEIYNWFTEGFDNVALKNAKALLDELVT